jgi:NADPH:quinone reductase
MRAVLCHSFTGPEDLRVGEIEEPKPASDEILVDLHATSVSFMDHLLVSGGYQMQPPTPFVPGTEGAGIVAGIGSAVTRFKPGDRVACGGWTGGYAERMVAKEWKTIPLPDSVSFERAATVWHVYGTAHYALVERARAQRGETIFITGAAGGVGLAAFDLSRHLGLRIIGGIGSDDKADLVRSYGAAEVVNYRTQDLRERIKEITAGEGVDLCFDNVGGVVFEKMGPHDEVGRKVNADRLYKRADPIGAHEPPAPQELLDCRRLYRRLDRQVSRSERAHERCARAIASGRKNPAAH